MKFYQSGPFDSIPLKTKIFLGLSAVMVICLLFFFAFTFFLITLVSGLALFLFNLFQRAKDNLSAGQKIPTERPQPLQRRPSKNDDDVIDV